jgi:TolA-binding protein
MKASLHFLFALSFLVFPALCGSALIAQKTATFAADDVLYREALELYDKEKYAAAQQKFERYMAETDKPDSERAITAEYLAGLCAMYLFHKDAEYRLETFVQDHPESPWVRQVYFELATYNYQRKRYKKALEWFEQTDARYLQPNKKEEFLFKRAHANFEQENYDAARTDFFELKSSDGEFGTPSLYYYSHIAYTDGEWETALEGFQTLEKNPSFKPIVPYYITQILYNQGRYEGLLDYAPAFIDSTGESEVKRLPEISRLIGDAHYRENDYEAAIPYLLRYHDDTRKSDRSREDFFQLGYSYYQTGGYEEALEYLNEASKEEDELAQSAVYHMADCYLKLDQKAYARTAFREASEMDFNREIKEDALFNYAKLAFELSYNPFDEAITAFETYLENYPDSPRRDEAYEFLLNVYMKTKAYEKAIASLERIENKDTRTKEAYQIVAFNRGVELFQAGKHDAAENFFNKVDTYKVNPMISAEAMFWKAELAYRKREYSRATALYNQFLSEPGSYQSPFYNDAHYGAGYSLFNQKKYVSAATAFRKYIDRFAGDDVKKKTDALLRIGDCYYVNKDYGQAISYYDQAIAVGQQMADYAMYQKALCHGLMGNSDAEISVLTELIETQIDSRYTEDAKYELAKTYLQRDEPANARKWYENILNEHPNSRYVKYSLLDLCLVYLKTGNNPKVIELWNTIKTKYPNDKVTVDAFNLVEEVLIEEGMLDELPENLGLTDADIEDKVYSAAADYAITGQCAQAISKLEDYLRKYQPGLYATPANFYLANCYFESGRIDDALNAYNYVISQPVSDFTEQSLIAAATINYNRKNYDQALNHYIELETIAGTDKNLLEAQIGQMRCYYFIDQLSYAKEYAEKVIANADTPDDILVVAHLWKGRILKEEGNYDDAYYDFAEVVKRGGAKAAEAKYNMAEIAYLKEAYKAAETEIFELIEKYSGFEEWKFRGFLLLSDVYVGLEDYFQARVTLQTIMDNVDADWVRLEAEQKLRMLEELENPEEDSTDDEEIEIDLNPEEE